MHYDPWTRQNYHDALDHLAQLQLRRPLAVHLGIKGPSPLFQITDITSVNPDVMFFKQILFITVKKLFFSPCLLF